MTKILAVDDQFLITHVIASALEDEGFVVMQASNGKTRLEVFDREHPALVVTDVMMPAINGLEFTHMLKLRLDSTSLPIILMSGSRRLRAHTGGCSMRSSISLSSSTTCGEGT